MADNGGIIFILMQFTQIKRARASWQIQKARYMLSE